MARDLTQGSITKSVLVMAIPTMIGFSAQMIYDLVDIFWIGHISTDAIAGVGIFATLFWVVEALNETIGASSVAMISQNFGRKDMARTNLAIEQTITFKGLVACLGAVLVALFLKPLMGLFAGPDVVELGLEYGYIRLFFLPIMFSSYSVNTALRCTGDSKTPMYIMIATNTVNCLLDPILMFEVIPGTTIPGFNLGIFGAALATIISQTLAFLIGFYLLFSGKRGVKPSLKNLFRLHKETDKKLMTLGLPIGFEVFMRQMFMVVLLRFIAIFGTEVVSAFTIGIRLLHFALLPLFGLSMGGAAVVGQSLGVDLVERAKRTAYVASFLGMLAMIAFFVATLFVSEEMISFFSQDATVATYGSEILMYGAFGLIILSYAFGLHTVFFGAGYNIPFLYIVTGARWGVQVPLLCLFILVLKWPVLWIWLSQILGDTTEFVITLFFFRQGKWTSKRA